MKTKEQIKASATAKSVKAKAKKGKILMKAGVVSMLLVGVMGLMAGCSTPASRAITMNFDRNTINVNVYAAEKPATNDVDAALVEAVASSGTIGDFFSPTMVVENSGTETTTQEHQVSPKTDVSVPVGLGGGESLGGAVGGIIERVAGKSTAATAAGAAASECTDGTCSDTAPK